jgi:glutaminyl-tRNA synthetase
MLLMTMLVVVGWGEASQRKVAGTLLVSIKHAVEAEVRLYDRLFIDEAPDSHKKKLLVQKFKFSGNVKGFVEPSLASSLAGINFSSTFGLFQYR